MPARCNRQNMQKLIDALRSDAYSQDRGSLRTAKGYCCLGVACDVSAEDVGGHWVRDGDTWRFRIGPDWDGAILPHAVAEWLGITNEPEPLHMSLPGDTYATAMNDAGASFDTIADAIEAYYLADDPSATETAVAA